MFIRKFNSESILICLILFLNASLVRGTFSIVAIDTVTNEVGIAAASCVPGGIISDICHVEPNVGGMIAQAYYVPENLAKGVELIRENKPAMDIINELVHSDEKAYDRQYGIITLHGGMGCFFGTDLMLYGTFANSTVRNRFQCTAFTGKNNPDWQGHIVGENYTIHGNTLSGANILLDMEEAFVNTEGPLPIKLIAALQAAKQIGADSRCDSTSSLCACIKVGRPDDPIDDLMLNINVTNVEGDPIDSLQAEFDRVYIPPGKSPKRENKAKLESWRNFPNPFNPSTTIEFACPRTSHVALEIYDLLGRKVKTLVDEERAPGRYTEVWSSVDETGGQVPAGIYIARFTAGEVQKSIKLTLIK